MNESKSEVKGINERKEGKYFWITEDRVLQKLPLPLYIESLCVREKKLVRVGSEIICEIRRRVCEKLQQRFIFRPTWPGLTGCSFIWILVLNKRKVVGSNCSGRVVRQDPIK